jgi:SAM-dependent methyltransferase
MPEDRYTSAYSDLSTPSNLTLAIRKEEYGEDIGQHSWVTKGELDNFIRELRLSPDSKILDIGCGAGGPARYIAKLTGCQITGIDVNQDGIDVGRKLASQEGLAEKVTLMQVDAAQGLPFPEGSFDVVLSFETVIHIKNRDSLFAEIARVLLPGGDFLFTDAGILTGFVSSEEIALRCINGFHLFHPPGANEKLLQKQGFDLRKIENTTNCVAEIARARLRARDKFKSNLIVIESTECFEQEQSYGEVAMRLAEEKRLSRFSYWAKKQIN